MKRWNPRYVAYAKAHGRTPAKQLKLGQQDGTHMLGFMMWIAQCKEAFFKQHPEAFLTNWNYKPDPHYIKDFDMWDHFLQTKGIKIVSL